LKVLVDTPIWSLALRRQPHNLNPTEAMLKSVFAELVNEGRVLMIGAIRQELLSGFREEAQFNRLRELLRAFPDLQLKKEDFERGARMANQCASRGLASTPTDMLICSVAYDAKAPIYSPDRDFQGYSKVLPIRLFTPEKV
jgi:predicted nucleic acid-binding protein